MNNDMFAGVRVVTGAGVGRKKKDKLLIRLIHELQIPVTEFVARKQWGPRVKNPIDILKCTRVLRKEYASMKHPPRVTFREFAQPRLGADLYKDFLVSSGYTDYENADVEEVLYHYGLDDDAGGWTGLSIPWRQLIETLADHIGWKRIRTSEDVFKVGPLSHGGDAGARFRVQTRDHEYLTKKVILALTVAGVTQLLPGFPMYRGIRGQPFLRLYGKVAPGSVEWMKERVPMQTNVGGLLYKVIPIDGEKGVYMIAYNDNRGAEMAKSRIANTAANRRFWETQLGAALGGDSGGLKLSEIRGYYWPIGTHYYTPLPSGFSNRLEFIAAAQHPMPDMLVVGEMVSRSQGWSQGALESVEAVLDSDFIFS